MEKPPFWWYLLGQKGIFMGYVMLVYRRVFLKRTAESRTWKNGIPQISSSSPINFQVRTCCSVSGRVTENPDWIFSHDGSMGKNGTYLQEWLILMGWISREIVPWMLWVWFVCGLSRVFLCNPGRFSCRKKSKVLQQSGCQMAGWPWWPQMIREQKANGEVFWYENTYHLENI